MKLTDGIDVIKGIGEKKKKALNSKGIFTLEDLIWWFPKKYQDRRRTTDISKLTPGKEYLVEGTILSRRFGGNPYNRRTPLSFLVADHTGRMEVVYFNGRFIAKAFNINEQYTFYGKVSENMGRLQMIHPESHKSGSPDDIREVLPVYPEITGISQKEIRKYQRALRNLYDDIEEWIPKDVVRDQRLASSGFALENIHFPQDQRHVLMSRFRLIFEELFTLQTGLLYIKGDNVKHGEGISIDPSYAGEFIDSLPFDLTEGQSRTWQEISKDLISSRSMNRLVQGDVGSGKTAVAEAAMYACVKNGYQAVMMAPTEILAKQHLATLTEDFRNTDMKVGLLCGSMKTAEKNEVTDALANGDIDILVGTHAVIQPGVKFRDLGLVITDEQHRFGVEQRKRLSGKGANPNVMVMTATPIPRTLAVILYGELDISVIDTMPAGRKSIRTYSAEQSERDNVYSKIKEEIEKGHQAYVVAPLIEESEKVEARSVDELFDEIRDRFKYMSVGMIHGAMGQEEKDAIMESFVRGDLDILVSTVVIEIGINVPNATCMVIENTERFGLAQLHQLRGRVGRGSDQSYCYLITGSSSDVSKERVKIMCETTDGFRIAEEDLNLRGPGEIFGTRQHGLPELHLSDIVRHKDVLEKAKDAAASVLEKDPGLTDDEDRELRRRVQKMFGEDIKLEL